MRVIKVILIVIGLMGALAYSYNKRTTMMAAESQGRDGEITRQIRPIQLVDQVAKAGINQSVEILAARMQGDILRLDVRYTGDEEAEGPELMVGEEFGDSLPLQTDVALLYDSNSEAERSTVISRNLQFDLAPLKEKYRQDFSLAEGSILLRLKDFDLYLRYDF